MSQKVAEVVTARLVEQIRAGVNPWRKPWAGLESPINHAHGYKYNGINFLVLSMVAEERGYPANRWMTYNQIEAAKLDLGNLAGNGIPVLFFRWIQKDKDDPSAGKWPLMRYTRVFNIAHVSDVIWTPPDPPSGAERVECAEQIVADAVNAGRLPAPLFEGRRAVYSPATDTWKVPPSEMFYETPGYYGTVFHEAGHATGHESRLNRVFNFDRRSPEYCFEEAIAEMTSTMILMHCGILDDTENENSAAYLVDWLPEIEKDPRVLTRAASAATKAMQWIMGEYKEYED